MHGMPFPDCPRRCEELDADLQETCLSAPCCPRPPGLSPPKKAGLPYTRGILDKVGDPKARRACSPIPTSGALPT
eukprot:572594-Hanusia_phi.AAC.1